MAKQKYNVIFLTTLTVEIDDKVIAQVDDDWRRQFYANIKKPEDVVQHVAFNHLFNNLDLDQIDGFWDLKDDLFKEIDRDIDCEGVYLVAPPEKGKKR